VAQFEKVRIRASPSGMPILPRLHFHMNVSVRLAEIQLSVLLDRAASGEEVIITKAGKPLAKLVPIEHRMFGSAKGKFTVPDDFNDPLPKEIEDLFYK
jgi:prevent-host-death family protein